ncbi:unnamed protein product [Macrosiphum euphorbiae]|uniref:C2H2-type domain-containing protein n=1 Tax=Macrosiphum euphorbiae TaxID=13131 RepID=A0AAV0W9G4_9HEMI|nr:unnamed protein product [Macrosiphum euphorbiae]
MFKCEQCPSTFTRKDTLVRHGKTHTGIHFPCTICQSTFAYKTSLTKHLKNVHDIVPALRQPYAQLDQPPAPIVAQQSVIQFALSSTPQGHIQIAPQIFVPDVSAGGSNMMSEDEICMAAMDEYEDTG